MGGLTTPYRIPSSKNAQGFRACQAFFGETGLPGAGWRHNSFAHERSWRNRWNDLERSKTKFLRGGWMENNLIEKKVKVVSIRNIFNFPEFRGFEDVAYMTWSYMKSFRQIVVRPRVFLNKRGSAVALCPHELYGIHTLPKTSSFALEHGWLGN